jgi:nucleotide-binding universal stress UspA family protein
MERKIDDYIAPLKAAGCEVTTILRTGNPRGVIMQTLTELKADVLVIGSHSKRSFFELTLGGTAKHVSQHASCQVVLVSPEKHS